MLTYQLYCSVHILLLSDKEIEKYQIELIQWIQNRIAFIIDHENKIDSCNWHGFILKF